MTRPSDRGPPRPDARVTQLVHTTEPVVEKLGVPRVHQLSREETAAWNDDDAERRDEARAWFRDVVREQGGGELRDAKGNLLEVVTERRR